VVEYATVTAVLGMLASSLSGSLGTALPASNTTAASRIAAVARAHHVPAAQAQSALGKAPYGTPALRYLYAVGWVSAASNVASCRAAQVLGPDPRVAASQALRGSPKTLALLRASHVQVSQAAAAIGRGTTDGCS